MLHDILLILATIGTWIVIQRLAQRALFDYAQRWMERMSARVKSRRSGVWPMRAGFMDRIFTASEEDALDRLVNGEIDEATAARVYSDWLAVRAAYDRHTGKRL